jgi:tetratricopeptide (TPR) repeat protein
LQWIRKILGYKGSVDVGLDELRMAYQYSISKPEFNFLEQESLFFLSFLTVMLNTEKDKTTDFVDSYLKSKKSDGRNLEPLQAYSMARLLLFTGRNDDAIKIIRSYRKGQIPIYYLDYMLGTAYLNKLSDSCLIYYNQYLRSYKGNFYIKSTIQKMAWYYLLTGSETMYRQTLNRIASYPDSKSEPDQTAEKELKTGVAPNVLLLKARLLSDGGYYKLALKVMLSTRQDECCMDAKSSIEYSYRLGRIYEETARREVAIDQFKYTYTKGKEYPYYFAANSCIQIGKLYEEAGNYPEAEKWYQNCLDLNFTEYRKSLRYKAEFNLKRIRNRITQ